jgi:hypothetical protein
MPAAWNRSWRSYGIGTANTCARVMSVCSIDSMKRQRNESTSSVKHKALELMSALFSPTRARAMLFDSGISSATVSRISGDIRELAVVIEQEKQAAVEFLQAQYRDIQQNFDPSVVPLRK